MARAELKVTVPSTSDVDRAEQAIVDVLDAIARHEAEHAAAQAEAEDLDRQLDELAFDDEQAAQRAEDDAVRVDQRKRRAERAIATGRRRLDAAYRDRLRAWVAEDRAWRERCARLADRNEALVRDALVEAVGLAGCMFVDEERYISAHPHGSLPAGVVWRSPWWVRLRLRARERAEHAAELERLIEHGSTEAVAAARRMPPNDLELGMRDDGTPGDELAAVAAQHTGPVMVPVGLRPAERAEPERAAALNT